MEQHTITSRKTARFFTLGNLTKETENVWIICHGYGQLANYFLRNFSSLANNKTAIIAPEGFHRYYLNGFSGRVGASWMTKEDRLNDISDYVYYLDQVASLALESCGNKTNVNVIGFSQGGATATRWTCMGKTTINKLILWAAVYPPDSNFDANTKILNSCDFRLVIGNQDEFVSEESISKHVAELDQLRIKYKLIRYEGGHKIYPEVFNEALG